MESWPDRSLRTILSSVPGLTASYGYHSSVLGSLQEALRTLQRLNIKLCRQGEIERQTAIDEGETFAVERCIYDGKTVAVKRLKMGEGGAADGDVRKLGRRLANLLLDLRIMHHTPLRGHPNILDLVGYGWSADLVPFVVVDYASLGNSRTYLRDNAHRITFGDKIIFIGDVAAGLAALHECEIVHGDLKLDNVLIFHSWDRPSNAIAKICDFGYSLIISEYEPQRMRYTGTLMYNAPEIRTQQTAEIPPEDLHKCDIWAFALLVWEILLDGERYFDECWHTKSPGSVTGDWDSKNCSFEDFDLSLLRGHALDFVAALPVPNGGGGCFLKGALRALFANMLQVDPAARRSDLKKMPIMTAWNAIGQITLGAQLSKHVGASELTCDLFRHDNLLWHYQEQIFEEIKASSVRATANDQKGNMIFQLALCYVLGFGTPKQPEKASELVAQATQLGHPVATVFGEQLCSGIAGQLVHSYNLCVSRGLRVGMVKVQSDNELLCALFRADAAAARVLINAGTDVRGATTVDGCSPFHMLFIFGEDSYTVGAKMLINPNYVYAPIAARLSGAVSCAAKDLYRCSVGICDTHGPTDGPETTGPGAENYPLDFPCTAVRRLHPQWPLEFSGTPLAFAICADSEPAVRALLALGADPCADAYSCVPEGKRNHWTALHLAASLHSSNLLQILLDHIDSAGVCTSNLKKNCQLVPLGCTLPYSSKLERSAMHGSTAAKDRLLATVKLLTPDGAAALGSLTHATPLIQAIDFADLDVVSAIVACYPQTVRQSIHEPEKPTEWIRPVHFAAQLAGRSKNFHDGVKILDMLIALDDDGVHSTDSQGRTPLHFAAKGNFPVAARWLVEKCSANINAADRLGRRPLHFVSSVCTMEYLLSASAILDARDLLGRTPLHCVCETRCLGVAYALIERGALRSPDAHDGVLSAAVRGKSHRIVASVLASGVSAKCSGSEDLARTPLYLAVEASRTDIVELLLAAGASVTTAGDHGRTLLHVAAEIGYPQMMARLLGEACSLPPKERDAWVNAQDRKGLTALHIAARETDVPLGKLLLAHDADVTIRGDSGKTPLHTAVLAVPIRLGNGFAAMRNGGPNPINKREFCKLLLAWRTEVLTIFDHRGCLPWHYSWNPPNGSASDFEMLALFFAERYQLAQPQLVTGDTAAHVLRAAIRAGDTNELVASLLSQLAHWLPPDLVDTATKWLRSTTGDSVYERTLEKMKLMQGDGKEKEIRDMLRGEFSHMMTVDRNAGPAHMGAWGIRARMNRQNLQRANQTLTAWDVLGLGGSYGELPGQGSPSGR